MRPPSNPRSAVETEDLYQRRVETHKRVMHAADHLINMQRESSGAALDDRYKQLFGSMHTRTAKSARKSARETPDDSAPAPAPAPDTPSSASCSLRLCFDSRSTRLVQQLCTRVCCVCVARGPSRATTAASAAPSERSEQLGFYYAVDKQVRRDC